MVRKNSVTRDEKNIAPIIELNLANTLSPFGQFHTPENPKVAYSITLTSLRVTEAVCFDSRHERAFHITVKMCIGSPVLRVYCKGFKNLVDGDFDVLPKK